MPLNVDKLTSDTIALAHNGKQNGDVMADPDMEVRIYPQEVYPEPGKYYPKLKKELNEFLNNWLKTMIEIQRYQLASEERE